MRMLSLYSAGQEASIDMHTGVFWGDGTLGHAPLGAEDVLSFRLLRPH